jgi:hypothetical protein
MPIQPEIRNIRRLLMQMLDAYVHEPKYRYFARTAFPCIKKMIKHMILISLPTKTKYPPQDHHILPAAQPSNKLYTLTYISNITDKLCHQIYKKYR